MSLLKATLDDVTGILLHAGETWESAFLAESPRKVNWETRTGMSQRGLGERASLSHVQDSQGREKGSKCLTPQAQAGGSRGVWPDGPSSPSEESVPKVPSTGEAGKKASALSGIKLGRK